MVVASAVCYAVLCPPYHHCTLYLTPYLHMAVQVQVTCRAVQASASLEIVPEVPSIEEMHSVQYPPHPSVVSEGNALQTTLPGPV